MSCGHGLWPLAAFALAYGVVYGCWVALLSALVADYFGGRNVSGIIGILDTSVAFGTLISPSAAGYGQPQLHAADSRRRLRGRTSESCIFKSRTSKIKLTSGFHH
jgi:MFS family permease